MKDNLQDLISHIHGLSDIDLIRIDGTSSETYFAAVCQKDDGKIVIEGKFTVADPEFIGTFGMPNLNKLKTILGFDEYDEHAKVYTSRDDGIAKSINFESKSGDFINNYRLMAEGIVKDKIPKITFKEPPYNVEFEPTVEGISRLKKQAQANSEEQNFKIKLDNGDVKIIFGDPATHNGNFVFYPKVSGAMNYTLQFPVSLTIQVLNMAGNKKMRISERGMLDITIDSGLAIYRYLIPAVGK